MIFRMYRPTHPVLHPYVQTIWYIAQDAREALVTRPRMIPDGRYHMVINLGSPHVYIDKNGKTFRPQRSHVNAKQTEFVTMERTGQVEIMGVVFRPHGFYPFIRMPVSEIAGEICSMEELVADRFDLLEERLAMIPSVQEKCLALEHWLEGRLRQHAEKFEIRREILHAGERVVLHQGRIRIRQLAEELACSERSLERHFKIHYGISPKQFADLHRIRHVLHHMQSGSRRLIDYAALGDYYDQAHFTRVFKNMVGVPPILYLQNRDALSDLYKTEAEGGGTISGSRTKE